MSDEIPRGKSNPVKRGRPADVIDPNETIGGGMQEAPKTEDQLPLTFEDAATETPEEPKEDEPD